MRTLKVVIVGLLATIALGSITVMVLPALTSPFLGFTRKDPTYFATFARACDSLLAQHSLGTNSILEIPAKGESLPKLIQELRPQKVRLMHNHVWIQVGESRANGFGVTWRQTEDQSNQWQLKISGESLDKVLYATNR